MNLTALPRVFAVDPRLLRLRLWFAVGYLLIAIIVFLSLTTHVVIPWEHNMDKWYHGIAYFSLMFWWLQIFPRQLARYLLALVFIVMSGAIEILQSFDPMRHMDWWDFAVNALGTSCAIALGWSRLDQLLYRFERAVFRQAVQQ